MQDPGIVPRVVRELFAQAQWLAAGPGGAAEEPGSGPGSISGSGSGGVTVSVRMSVLEIYNEVGCSSQG
jgi:hypothetical protein